MPGIELRATCILLTALSLQAWLVLFCGPYPQALRVYSWLCACELLLVGFRGPYGVSGIKHESNACKANAFPMVLSLQPPS